VRRVTLLMLCALAAAATCLAAPEAKTSAQLLAQMAAAAASFEDYEVSGVGETNGKREEFKVYFKKPELVRIDTERGQVAVQPNGTIRGRLGKGPFGMISKGIGRDDAQLRDSEGVPFWNSHYAATVARIQEQVKNGAKSSVTSEDDTYELEVRSGNTTFYYTVDKKTLFFRENRRTVGGKVVETTRYSGFRPNTGMKATFFKF
jgi:outer membrane lipoprotein-sorting protein